MYRICSELRDEIYIPSCSARLSPPPLPIHRPLGRGLLAVEVAQAPGFGLVAGGDGFLGTGFGVAVVGNDAGVVAGDFFVQVAEGGNLDWYVDNDAC